MCEDHIDGLGTYGSHWKLTPSVVATEVPITPTTLTGCEMICCLPFFASAQPHHYVLPVCPPVSCSLPLLKHTSAQ